MKRMMMSVAIGVLAMAAQAGWAGELPWRGKQGVEFHRIESRLFDAARYDASSRTLTIVFSSGAAYSYAGVEREVYLDFTRIVNKGEYFNRRIRTQYPCERIDEHATTWATRD
ncbi:MAG: KTSC domain-containing protein [Kiritimatiellae bacterium]|nr:KTSC domain-containing protein [Kiritimatiellia bacterium]